MTRLITWSLIILAFGLGLIWMVASAQANPRTLPKTEKPVGTSPVTTTEPTKPAPSLSEQAGTAARSAVEAAKEVGAQVVEKSGEVAQDVKEATTDAAAKTSEAVKQAGDSAKQAADDFTKGFNQPKETPKP